MLYGLSFGPDFFWHGVQDHALSRLLTERPTSVEQAVSQFSEKTCAKLARDVFHCEPEFLTVAAVLEKIEETNTCLNLDSPVEVCVERNGEFTVLVYDRDDDR